jgi:hypothetical protein
MDYFGINSPNELPQINEVLMEELVKATVVNPEHLSEDSNENRLPEATASEENISDSLTPPESESSINEEDNNNNDYDEEAK